MNNEFRERIPSLKKLLLMRLAELKRKNNEDTEILELVKNDATCPHD